MTMSRLRMTVVLFAFAAFLGGCCGGSKTTVEHLSPTKTVGEQMTDLQKARDTGAISEEEYKKAKQAILDKIEK